MPECPKPKHSPSPSPSENTMEPSTDEKKTKRKHSHDNEDHPTNCFDGLPHDTLVDILSRLPVTSLFQLSFVSRSSYALSHHPHVVNSHLSRSSLNGSSCFILHSDYPLQNHLHFLHLRDSKAKKFNTPFASWMPEFSILGSSNGLLCLVDSFFPESFYLYNPFTRAYLELPKSFDLVGQVVVYGYGFSPISDDYKVIKISYYTGRRRHESSEVQVYSLRCNVWKSRGVMPYTLEAWSSPGVVMSGRVHWVKRSGGINGRNESMIVSCNLENDEFHVMKQPASFSGYSCLSFSLAALDGCLWASARRLNGFDFWTMKEYGVEESWVKAYSIGKYYPESMISHEMERTSHIWRRSRLCKKEVKILSVMDSGELLLDYRGGGGGLVLYDSQLKTFEQVKLPGMPRLYQTTLHVGSLKSVALK